MKSTLTWLSFFLSMYAANAVAESVSINIQQSIPEIPEPQGAIFKFSEEVPLSDAVLKAPAFIYGFGSCIEVGVWPPPAPPVIATLKSAFRRYHHIDALLGLEPYVTTYVLRLRVDE